MVASLVKSRARQHREVVAGLAKRESDVVEARRNLEAALAAYEAKVDAAIESGGPMPKPRMGGAEEAKVERAEEELKSFEPRVPKSARNLIVHALPFLDRASELVAEEQELTFERSKQLLAALDTALAEHQALADEAAWIESAANGARHVEPFRARGGDRQVGQLRGAIRDAFAEFEATKAKYEAEAERVVAYEREHADEWQRQEAAAREQAARERIVVEDGRIVERGGQKVRRSTFGGVEPMEDEAEDER